MIKNKEKNNVFTEMKIIKDNFKIVQIIIIILSLYFLIIGLFILKTSSNIYSLIYRFDDKCTKNVCELNFHIKNDIKGPFYVYIGFKNFYLNNRKVMLSLDKNQLRGDIINDIKENDSCKNYFYYKHGKRYLKKKFEGSNLNKILHPCGLNSLLYNKCYLKRRYKTKSNR